jgi:hypothetical protein
MRMGTFPRFIMSHRLSACHRTVSPTNRSGETHRSIQSADASDGVGKRQLPTGSAEDIVKWIARPGCGQSFAQRTVPMREKSSIKFEIPLPWASAPARIEACGRHAVVVAGTVAVIFFTLIVLVTA